MECVYSRFESFHFEGDARYLEGLNKLHSTLTAEDLLKLKIFFYNKFVEPIDLPGYLQCRAQSSTSDHTEEKRSQDSDCSSEKVTPLTDPDVKSVQEGQLSFTEVFRMVQNGEDIPGLEKLDIKPCNLQPTVSQMSRKLKPWEK